MPAALLNPSDLENLAVGPDKRADVIAVIVEDELIPALAGIFGDKNGFAIVHLAIEEKPHRLPSLGPANFKGHFDGFDSASGIANLIASFKFTLHRASLS